MARFEHGPDELGYTADNRQVLGKRPAFVKWTPSKPMPWWFGNWEGDHRFTAEQWNAVIGAGGDPDVAEAVTVRREPGLYDPDFGGAARVNLWLPIYQFECPLIQRLPDQSSRVIGPNGKPRTVRPDGWATAPSSKPYRGQW